MLYRCRRCDHEEARGCLPAVGCGVYLFGLMGCVSVVLILVVQWMRAAVQDATAALRAEMPPHEPIEAGWWNLLLIPLSLIIGIGAILIGTFILKFLVELIEYLVYCFRKCPNCGARRWSWGFTRGFGL